MFKIDKAYQLEMMDSYDDEDRRGISSIMATVVRIDGPLVQFNIAGSVVIVNTHSLAFVRATQARRVG
jgi:hypothetical protein